jgi:DNA-binding NarL/FixJ family response regulator
MTTPTMTTTTTTSLPMQRTSEPDRPDQAIRVLVVDDHPTVHLGLAAVVAAAEAIELVATATSGLEGFRKFVEEAPDVVILDLSMPGQTGLVTLRQILGHDPDALVLVLTASAVAEHVIEAVRSGAAGYLLKDIDGAALVDAVRAVRRGEVPIDARLTRALARMSEPPSRVRLTQREHDVLRLLRDGLSNQQMGVRLGIRPTTVKTHLRNAFGQIGVTDRTSAALWAQRHLDDVDVR